MKMKLAAMREHKWPKVAVIILNWNGLDDTRMCLNSFKKVTYPNFEIVIVDNGSAINEAEIISREFGRYFRNFHTIRSETNLGFCGGNNLGIDYARKHIRPDYYLLINNDVIVHPDFLTNLVLALEENPAVGMASPKIFCYPEKDKLWRPGVHEIRVGATFHIKSYDTDTTKETDMVNGCCMLIKSEVIEKIGLLRPEFFLSGWDTLEYSLRAKRANFKLLYVPSAVIWHKYSAAGVKLNIIKRFEDALVGDVTFCALVCPRGVYLPLWISQVLLKFLRDRIIDVVNVLTKPEKRRKLYTMIRGSFG
jgi:GT2 family glycosyltransferase